MNPEIALNRYLARYPYVAVAAYVVLVVAFLVTIWVALASVLEQRAVLADSLDILNQLEARQQNPNAANNQTGAVPAGSPNQASAGRIAVIIVVREPVALGGFHRLLPAGADKASSCGQHQRGGALQHRLAVLVSVRTLDPVGAADADVVG